MEKVILVNEKDEETGVIEKMEAHRKALLHRAFSVFIFNDNKEMLLQQRSLSKYHSGGLWSNACCSHPRPRENTRDAANRRLYEELGFDTPLRPLFKFIYKAPFDNGLTEHELDHVFTGTYNGHLNINPQEVNAYRYMTIEEVENQLLKHPQEFTFWFHIAFPRVKEYIV